METGVGAPWRLHDEVVVCDGNMRAGRRRVDQVITKSIPRSGGTLEDFHMSRVK